MSSISLPGPGFLQGDFHPPGDKSISHRAVMFGALSDGRSTYTHFLQAEDCLQTIQIFSELGLAIDLHADESKVVIEGRGLAGFRAPAKELYCGNSGTTMRLLLGILAGQRFQATLTGDASLSSRPMKRVTQPLKQMGAQIKGKDNGNYSPLTIRGGKLRGIEYENKLRSAQVKSALLFAGLYAEGPVRVRETVRSRDHTERLLKAAGAALEVEDEWLVMKKTGSLEPLEMEIPGDISAAAFFIAGAAVTAGSRITVKNVGLNPTRTGVLEVLKRMGAAVKIEKIQEDPEPYGHVFIEGGKLCGTRITRDEIPALIDELPVLMTAMALAEGESLISGAEELRVKETDRIHSMASNLNALGAQVQELPDGCLIRGVERFQPGTVHSFGDHRTAMCMAVASLAMKGEVRIDDTECIGTSFPEFFTHFQKLRVEP